jgi:predicted phosphodiesterase
LRLAVLSDVHGNLIALERVTKHLAGQGADFVVNLGDCVSAPLWPRETYEALGALNAPTVRGNHDRWLGDIARASGSPMNAFVREPLSSDQRDALVALPPSLRIGDAVLAVHGTPASDTEYLLEDSVDDRLCLATSAQLDERLRGTTQALVLCGHSHQQHTAWVRGRRLVVNPGSVGCPRYAGNDAPARNEASSPHARYAIVTRRRGEWSAELLVLEYDWSPVIERARSLGFGDWADAFVKE